MQEILYNLKLNKYMLNIYIRNNVQAQINVARQVD